MEAIDIRDVIIKSGKCKGEAGIRKEKMEQVSHFALCSVFNLILGGTAFLHQNSFRKYRIQEMTGQKNQSGHAVISWQVRSPLQITGITTDVGSTHDASLVTLQMKRREINSKQKRAMNKTGYSRIVVKSGKGIDLRQWMVAQTGKKWKWGQQVKMRLKLQLWQLGSYLCKTQTARTKQVFYLRMKSMEQPPCVIINWWKHSLERLAERSVAEVWEKAILSTEHWTSLSEYHTKEIFLTTATGEEPDSFQLQAGSLVMISAWADKRNGYRKTYPGFRPERSGARSAMPEISEESADTLVHPVFPLQTPFEALHGHGCLQAPGLPRRKGADLSPTSATARWHWTWLPWRWSILTVRANTTERCISCRESLHHHCSEGGTSQLQSFPSHSKQQGSPHGRALWAGCIANKLQVQRGYTHDLPPQSIDASWASWLIKPGN